MQIMHFHPGLRNVVKHFLVELMIIVTKLIRLGYLERYLLPCSFLIVTDNI